MFLEYRHTTVRLTGLTAWPTWTRDVSTAETFYPQDYLSIARADGRSHNYSDYDSHSV